jgi:hypothetical protein
MAIDFSSEGLFKAPKINFIPEDVPLEAFEKSSEVLNKRYETSADAATRAQEALAQQLQTANELEKPALKAYYDQLIGNLTDIATKDDYIDQEWKTKALALKTGANLKTQEERKKLADETVGKIRTAKNISKPLKRKMWEDEFNKQFSQTAYDPATGLINFSPLNAPRIVEDANIPEILNKGLTGFFADVLGTDVQTTKLVKPGELIPGTDEISTQYIVYDTKTKSKIQDVKETDVAEAADNIIKSDPTIQAYLGSEKDVLKYEDPKLNDAQVDELVKQNIVEPAKKYISSKLGYVAKETANAEDINLALTQQLNNVYNKPPDQPFNPWAGQTSDIETKEAVQPTLDEKAEVSSEAFDQNENFKGISESFIKKFTNTWARLGNGMWSSMFTNPDSGVKTTTNFNDLVPERTQAAYKADNPTMTPKQIYEKFMDEKADYKKRMITNYVITGADTRDALNKGFRDFASLAPIYDMQGNEITDVEERNKILNQQVSFVPAKGQIKFGKDYVSGMGVMNPNAPQTNHNQKVLVAASKMINAALNPEIYNASTRDMFGDQGIKLNVNGQLVPVNFRVMKTVVGKKVLQDGTKPKIPTRVEMVVGGPQGKVLRQFVVDGTPEGQKGMNDFIGLMLNNAALYPL